MSLLTDLALGFTNKHLPVILQTESTECGLACLGMVAGFHGYRTDLATLRNNHSVSLKGSTLADLIKIAGRLRLSARAVRLELEDLSKLSLPCIVHWDFDHYVVLKSLRNRRIVIHDPAVGERRLTQLEFSTSFTGVALELWPNAGFERKVDARKLALRKLIGRVTGLFRSSGQVLLLALALEIFAIVMPFFIEWVVDQGIPSADRDLLTTLAVGFGLVTLMRVAVSAVRSWVVMHMSTILSVQWRANVFSHLLSLPVQYFYRRHLGDVTSRFGSIDQIQNTLTTSFLEAILDGTMSIVALAMMLVYSRLLGAVAAATMVLYAVTRWVWFGALRSASSSQIVFAAKQQSHFLESMRGVRTIKLFQRETERSATWMSILIDQINAGLRAQKLQIIYSSINGLLIGIETVLVIWLGSRMILDGAFSIGILMAFKSYDDQFTARSSGLIDKLLQLQMLRLYGERLADIVLSEPERVSVETVAGASIPEHADVKVSNLRYRYSEQDPLVLNGVTFDVTEGETVAVVGPSGCGKSTLIGVLLGILPPTGGDVIIGGASLQRLGPGSLRRIVGCVMQDDVLFAGSIRENISFFDPSADFAWIEECARMASIHGEIVDMPMGYSSLVGDMGTVLSGGQKQRILLARALYKRPRLLLLDEATSQLDVEREQEINSAITQIGITRIIVAHRPDTIAAANRVLLLQNGRIVTDERRPRSTDESHGRHERHASSLPRAPGFMQFPAVQI